MDCRKFDSMIDGYLRNNLSAGDHRNVETHLGACAACRETLAEHQALEVILDKACEWTVESPSFLTQRMISNLPAKVASGFWSWKVIHPIVAVVSLVLALAIGFEGRDIIDRQQVGAQGAQIIRIIFYSPEASSVALIGDFNDWGQRDVTLAQSSDKGIWEFSMTLKPGVYHYNMLVDGEKWVANPKSSSLVPDGFGGYDSVLVVSEKCQDDCA